MAFRMKRPGSALQRATGAEREFELDHRPLTETYAICSEFQSRHVMRRCGVGRRKAAVLAALVFGEGRG